MSRAYLRVKIRSLAAESKIIRHEEKKLPGPNDTRKGLRLHRIGIVREESRVALIAYGYLRGRTYDEIEGKSKTPPDLKRVGQLIIRFGDPEDKLAGLDIRLNGWYEAKNHKRLMAA